MKNIYYALFLSIVVISWMALGQLGSTSEASEAEALELSKTESSQEENASSDALKTKKSSTKEAIRVEVKRQQVQSIAEKLEVSGHTEPNKTIQLRAELSGKINAISVNEGQMVKKGQLVASLELRDKQIQLQKALALQTERQNAYERTQKLVASKLQSQSSIEQALSLLKSAQAEVASVELELERTKIIAPFTGLINQLDIEVGTFVEANTQIATLIAIDPLVISVNIPQQVYSRVRLGQDANIRVINGEKRKGKVKYLSSLANSDTRSFKAEIEIENKDGSLPAGLSAKATIETEMKKAHFISPALLSLDNEGFLGVKTVNTQELVEFYRINIINSESSGVWVSGLPDSANIITVGQGFVQAGTKVIAEPKKSSSSAQTDSSGKSGGLTLQIEKPSNSPLVAAVEAK